MLKNGEVDLVTSAVKRGQWEEDFVFSNQPVGTCGTMLTIKAGNEQIIPQDYSTYDGMRVGMIRQNIRNENFKKFAIFLQPLHIIPFHPRKYQLFHWLPR